MAAGLITGIGKLIGEGTRKDNAFRDLNTGMDYAKMSYDAANQALQGAGGAARGVGDSTLAQQQAFLNALGGQNAIANQSNVFQQQQGLADVLGQMVSGAAGTPSVAQNQLNQATGQNVAQQSAMMASQRGAGANPALLARQAAMAGGNIQQQAAGQAATLRAQEQLNAIGALQGQQGMMGQLASQQVGQQASGLQTQANMAAQQQQIDQARQNAIAANRQQQAQAELDKNKAKAQIHMMSEGGKVDAPKKMVADMLIELSQGGKVPALVSPGEIYLTRKQAEKVAKGEMNPMAGERIPGKAKVEGDSPKNDTVPKMLEVGGVVVKRTKAKDPEEAAKFVAAVKGKSGLKRK